MVSQVQREERGQPSATPPTPGSIVSCRRRPWVVLPSAGSELIRLRPLSGNEDEIVGIYTPLEGEIAPADFAPPSAEHFQDHEAARLLLDAARLNLRGGAGPFRCLGRLSVRPRPYQLVPLLMALRLEIIRLLISDDVGVGKSIEAGLIARELLDRGEIRRIGVLCPPHLCDQWQRELKQKFHIDAVVIRSGTVSRLERATPPGRHLFQHYPHIIVSLDYAKSERRRAGFLAHRPDFLIIDEAHTCADASKDASGQQQRYQLLRQIANDPNQHLVFLTATPHSGIETSFLSLIGLIKPEFENFDLNALEEAQRVELSRHFVQRRRVDVRDWLGDSTPFPERESLESAYRLSREYRELFEAVYDFARGLVREVAPGLTPAQKRGRYWSALAIVRCVMSSPAAAIATLTRSAEKASLDGEELDDELAATFVYDSTESEGTVDSAPAPVVERGRASYRDSDRRKLREFVKIAETLQGSKDRKLQEAIALVKDLLQQGYHPILWCRYIATANYVARALQAELEGKKNSNTRVIAITGELSEEEREIRIEELKSYPRRVMVATDCLSEGVNLQEHFTAVIHYDLPWNPNRLEQREGRVDRYGQSAERVKCILFYGQDNPVDGAVLEVLIRKAVTIHRSLGITVPVPMDSNTVQSAVFKSLFERATDVRQLSLFDLLQEESLGQVHQSWERAIEREKRNRTRFAQRGIKPEQVERELIESNEILGSESDVERFVLRACQRLDTPLVRQKQGWLLSSVPKFLQPTLGDRPRRIQFTTPTPEGIEYAGRNHPLVEGLARYLFESALSDAPDSRASRCGVTVTAAVAKPTILLLLRARYLLESPGHTELLAEECLARAFTGIPSNPLWSSAEESLTLLETAEPGGDLAPANKKDRLDRILRDLPLLEPALRAIAEERAEVLKESHLRVRALTREGTVRVRPRLPMDILGVYLFLPLS